MATRVPTSSEDSQRPRDEAAVAVCLYGEHLEPSEITALLGGKPTHSHKKGDPSNRSEPYDKGAWIREVRQFEPINPDEMVAEVFRSLSQDPSVWAELAARFRVQVDFALHTDAGCKLVLSGESLKTLAARHAPLVLDIYAYGDGA